MTYLELLFFRFGMFAFSYDDEESWEERENYEEDDTEEDEEDEPDDWY